MKRLRGLVLCLVLGSAAPALAQSSAGFQYWKTLDAPASKDEEIVGFDLDSDIYAATRASYPDLRVLDEKGAEAPYHIISLVKSHEERTHKPFGTEIVSLKEEGASIVVRLRLPQGSPEADGFSLATPLIDFERLVRVFGSTDGSEWTPLGDGVVYDYSRFMDVRHHEVAVPENKFREFQLVIEAVDEKGSPYTDLTRTFRAGKEEQRVERTTVEQRAFRINRIDAFQVITHSRVEKPETKLYPVAGFEARQNTEKKQTILHVRTRREPLRSFTLETKSRNFYRRAVVQVPVVEGVQTRWQPIGEATVFNLSFRSQRQEQLAIAFPEQREDEYRIVIENEDNPPLDITGVKAEGSIWRVLFLGQPTGKYRVFYGSEMAEAPKYEARALLTSLGSDYQPLVAKLGPQTDNQEYGGEPGLSLRKLLNNWIFLGTVIGLMVIVLGWCLFRAARHIEEMPKEHGE